MNGIEKIIQQIEADAKAENDQILQAAQAQADAIAADYAKQAEKIAAEGAARGQAAATQREERLASMAEMEGRKALLAVKQDMIGKAFDLAVEKLCALSEDEYIELLAKLAAKASTTGKEQVILSEADRARVGEKVVNSASALIAGTGMLTLSERTAPIRGGLILADGAVEINCSFEALINQNQNQMAGEVAKVLFE